MGVSERELAWARAYATAGFPLIPLGKGANGGVDKNPGLILGKGYAAKASCALDRFEEWAAAPDVAGFGLVIPLGLDVDDGQRLNRQGEFVTKSGGATLSKWEAAHGPLPPTYRISARKDEVNGIRLFLPPEGVDQWRWSERAAGLLGAGGDIEIIRPDLRHAFAVGTHPGAFPHEVSGVVDPGVYGEVRLYGPDGACLEPSQVPKLDDLPRISDEWFEHFHKRCRHDAPRPKAAARVARVVDPRPPDVPRSTQERVSGVGLSEAQVLERFEQVLVERHGWIRVKAVGAALAAFDHPEATSERSGTVSRGEGDRFRLHLFAGTAALSGIPLPVCEQGYSLWDLLLVEAGGDIAEAKRLADALGWSGDITMDDAAFWDQRPILAHIRDAAHARGVSAPAVLAVVLARFITEVDHTVTLPPLIGGRMSLNTYVALLGPSGAGKTSVMAVVEDLFGWTVDQESVGSGEGLIRGYGSAVRGVWTQDRTHQFLYVDEVVTLTAQTSKSGATLLGIINAGWTGGALSQQYADASKRARIPAHGYRLCLVVGVQVGKADDLLRHGDAGTPQRFIWAPLIDPGIPPPDQAPEWPGALELPALEEFAHQTTMDMQVANKIAAGIRERYHRRTTSWDRPGGDRDHDDLLRLKIGAALALLDGRMEILESDWSIAGPIMGNSRKGLQRIREDKKRREQQASETAGRRQAQRNAAAQEVEEDLQQAKKIDQAAGRIARHVHQHAPQRQGGFCVKKCAKNGLSQANLLEYFESAVKVAVDKHWLEDQSADGKRRLLPGTAHPDRG